MEYAPDDIATIPEHQTDSTIRLVSLVGSRLCHDLVSPLGAIGNGIELLQMVKEQAGESEAPEMQLIEQALQAARARIDGFRVAFGSAASGQKISASDFAALVRNLCVSTELQITLHNDLAQPRSDVKMVLLALMCLESALPWGARIRISQQGGRWYLAAVAERTKRDLALWSCLNAQNGSKPNVVAAEVQFPLLRLMADELARPLSWEATETGAQIRF
ncbi:histidine phosphotransferase family protein [Paracoccus albus]|uniref:histidine phosphotransferase family protein n=1 Tax=Paracoccus albus TaxID=3017784 RepID=UPI0022F0ECD2|nr:histidine phosphotransferase family protein [Paracoccus albus]WBU60975.1 histidine phosphotransferase family protein [Paracoccus albus]